MFEESLVESTAMLRTRSHKPVYTAIAVQAIIAAALLSVPLLHPELMPMHAPPMTLTAPVMPKAPPPVRVRVESAASTSAPSGPTYVEQTSSPGRLFQGISGPLSADDVPSVGPITMGIGNGVPFGIGGTGTGPAVSVRPEPAAHKGLLVISTGVMAGRLIVPIQPVYPMIAKETHTEGTVVIEAIISATGSIESAHAVSGPAMLQAAALDAVEHARYHPYLLNGVPTQVQTTVTVNFRMGS